MKRYTRDNTETIRILPSNYPEPEEYAHQPSGVGGQQCTSATEAGVQVDGRQVHAWPLIEPSVVEGNWLAEFELELNRVVEAGELDVPF